MRKLLLIISLFACIACEQSNKLHERIFKEAQAFIDEGNLKTEVLLIEEVMSNELVHVYRVEEENFPFFRGDMYAPTTLITYKDKYIALLEKDQPTLTDEDIEKKGFDTKEKEFMLGSISSEVYYLVISKKDNKQFIVKKGSSTMTDFYTLKETWPYLQHYTPQEQVNLILSFAHISYNERTLTEEDLPYTYPTRMYGFIHLTNLTDSLVIFPETAEKGGYFALLSGTDTLKLSVNVTNRISPDVELRPFEDTEISFSATNPEFFKTLTPLNDQTKLFELLRDSLFYIPTCAANPRYNYRPKEKVRVIYSEIEIYLNNVINKPKYITTYAEYRKGKFKRLESYSY